MNPKTQATNMLERLKSGDSSAADRLLPLVYDEMHELAHQWLRRNRRDHTLQPTALVHEVYLRLVGAQSVAWQNRAHFMAVAAKAMRQILIDHARRRQAAKRGGGEWRRVSLADADEKSPLPDADLIALDEALDRLAELNERQARIVELRYLAGLSVKETAHVMDVSMRTVKSDWRMARAWLSRELRKGDHS
jgi:RNA polymerase sigma factor (TIGR02999 family)